MLNHSTLVIVAALSVASGLVACANQTRGSRADPASLRGRNQPSFGNDSTWSENMSSALDVLADASEPDALNKSQVHVASLLMSKYPSARTRTPSGRLRYPGTVTEVLGQWNPIGFPGEHVIAVLGLPTRYTKDAISYELELSGSISSLVFSLSVGKVRGIEWVDHPE